MTREITKQAIRAFLNDENFKLSNTEVHTDCTGTYLYLFNNLIAKKVRTRISVSLAGYNTLTTIERLNGIPNVSITTRKGQAVLNGRNITDTEWVTIL